MAIPTQWNDLPTHLQCAILHLAAFWARTAKYVQGVPSANPEELISVLNPHSAASMRLVCRDWRAMVAEAITQLHGRHMMRLDHISAFPALVSLDLRWAQSVGVRHPSLEHSQMALSTLNCLRSLTRLCLGTWNWEPGPEVFRSIVGMTGLKELAFRGSATSDAGLKKLLPLSGTLQALDLDGCHLRHLDRTGCDILHDFTALTRLCMRSVYHSKGKLACREDQRALLKSHSAFSPPCMHMELPHGTKHD
mmetsp:Transcript_3300/g.9566  ORF Transcript_3300/g.9566 Transcript_3300/m.9566 type:complete len:250 (+) Transcript_3300:78-827(+)